MGINTTKFPLTRDDQTDQYTSEREEIFRNKPKERQIKLYCIVTY
jgi:hypothetical protein